MGGGQFADQKRKAAEHLAGVENPMDAPGASSEKWDFSPEDIEKFRAEEAERNPQYAALRNARMGKRGGGTIEGGAFDTGEGRGGLNIAALSDASSAKDQTRSEGAAHGVDISVDMGFSSDDPYARSRPAVSGSNLAHVTGSSFDARRASRGAGYEAGAMLVKTAGRCNHPRCQLIREKGLEMMGVMDKFQGIGIESQKTPIPSIPVDKPYYGTDPSTGKQNRKEVHIERQYKPADPSHPEWVAMRRGGTGAGDELFDPSDLLEHHHFPGDTDFERYPLPWDVKD